MDLGTTFTAASVHDGQRPQPVTLGARSLGIPSVVFVAADGQHRIGEDAAAPAMEDPTRLVYEFKRHIGSDADLLLPDGAYPATHFSTLLLRWVYDRVVQRMHDEAPAAVAVSHPAHWNEHLLSRHRHVLADAGLPDARTVTEPEAAAIFYATQAPVAVGQVVAVYDLGGGTFDAAVVRREAEGFRILGRPGGIGHLGGADFDKVVYAIINDHLDGALNEIDVADADVLTDLHVLAAECTRAKEQLSANTHVTIPVRVGSLKQSIRVTRGELERAIRPRIAETIATLEETLRSAELHPSQLSRVLLVGGSSRIPLVRSMVEEAMAVPVSEDNDPVAAVAIGASIFAHLHRPPGATTAGARPDRDEPRPDASPRHPRTVQAAPDEVPVRIRDGITPVDPPAPVSERAPALRVLLPDGRSAVLTAGEVYRAGRSADNELVVAGELVSRQHGRFHYDESDGWRFTDPGSRNGTYLDGQPLPGSGQGAGPRSAVLPEHGSLRVGTTGPELCFELERPPSTGGELRLRCEGRSLVPHGSRRFVIGRSEGADLRVDDPTRRVSSTHLELRPTGTTWALVDVSANGTFRGDGPIDLEPIPLVPGLELRLGAPDGPLLVVESLADDATGSDAGSTITVGRSGGSRSAGAGTPGAGQVPRRRPPAWPRWRWWPAAGIGVAGAVAVAAVALSWPDGDADEGESPVTSASTVTTTTSPATTSSTVLPTTVEVVVPGTSPWTDTGVVLEVGDAVAVTATGTVWHAASDPSTGVGPAGAADEQVAGSVLNTPGLGVYVAPPGHGGLVGWIPDAGTGCDATPGLDAVLAVGAMWEAVIERPGRLCLGINDYAGGAVDEAVANNDGRFDVTVTVTPRS